MGGKSGGKVEVNEYSMSMHLGVCHAVDAFTSITVGEKLAWSGLQSTTGDVTITQPELFGGVKKEGGVGGVVRFLLGLPNQVLPDSLATRLGRTSGATCPGFRGIASLFFTGTLIAGFYWTANNPYLKSLWIGVRRAPKGLNPAYAMIPRAAVV